jgi:translation initiation factor IF-3
VDAWSSGLSEETVIARRRFHPQQRETGKRLRINRQINISPVRLIDDDDQQIGVVDIEEALNRAREAGQDLVEVAPQARPPVCRIMDYGKWKYQQRKKEQKAKSHSKQSELKEVRLRPKIDDHDLAIKLEKAREFLDEGDKVQFTMLFRGREMAHRDLGVRMMNEIRDGLADISKVDSPPRPMGRRMTMVLSPERKAASKGGGDRPPKPVGEKPAAAKPAPQPVAAARQAVPASQDASAEASDDPATASSLTQG